MKKDQRVYLAQILERIIRIQTYTKGGKESFLGDALIQDAVIRNLEVIGEAATRITVEYRTAHPEFPWRGMAALRNVLMHDYEGVDLHKVWRVVEKELPPLKTAIERILPPLDELEREITGE
jgi:uncharacterized protein with HEPN domain